MPRWYSDIQIATYLGCKPWELQEIPDYWRERARTAMKAEAEAQRMNSHKRK